MSSAVIYVWAEPVKIKGSKEKEYMGYAMAGDGTMVRQQVFSNIEWLKAGFGVGQENKNQRAPYDELYVCRYEVVWLDEPYNNMGWWEARFFQEQRYKLTRYPATALSPPLVEFRVGSVLGYVVEVPELSAFYVVPGAVTPRTTDEFPPPGYLDFVDAMQEAHDLFKGKG
jgi:hypothetical protein